MQKKLAFMVMGSDFDPSVHNAHFSTETCAYQLCTVRNPDEAKAKTVELAAEGVGIIEVCGAFGPELAREMIALAEGKVGIGYVVHHPEQDKVFDRFFS